MKRLNTELLASLPVGPIKLPAYDRAAISNGIVHLGIGAFHRAHQAWYTEAVLNKFGGDWGITGCSLRSAGVFDQLNPQDGLYTVVEKSSDGEAYQIVGAVKDVLVGPQNPAALIDLMSSSQTKIVSLTVTEKGYCHDPATGALNFDHPDIAHDLENLAAPKSAIGYIAASLRRRMLAGKKSFTALSCDNLPNNGEILEAAVTQFAERLDPVLAKWIKAHTTFPCTMIDRIVPATTSEDRARLSNEIGYIDEGVVVTEPFSQWVIEDNFCNERPAWERVGALLVDDVSVFENLKLRLLNGSHSFMAYCGYLSGFETISDVMSEPAFERAVTWYMDHDAGAVTYAPPGFDADGYKRQLRERFKNASLRHKTWQIAMDGSQKIPQRFVGSLKAQISRRGDYQIIVLALAGWIRYVSGVDEHGEPIDVQDPMAQKLAAVHADCARDLARLAQEMLGIEEVFGSTLHSNSQFVSAIGQSLEAIYRDGMLATIKNLTA